MITHELHARAQEILRQVPCGTILTMAEAVTQAQVEALERGDSPCLSHLCGQGCPPKTRLA